MTALRVILLIVAWLLIGIAFARRFRVALAESVGPTAGFGWAFILLWPVWGLFLVADSIILRMADFRDFGDRLAAVPLTQENDPTSHDRMLAAVAAGEAQISQHLDALQIVDGPFILEGGKVRPARKAQEDTFDGTDQ